MTCCATGRCGNEGCALCVELPKRFPPIEPCPKQVTIERRGKRVKVPCRYIKGHCVGGLAQFPTACKPHERDVEKLDTRDGDPCLPGEKKRAHPAFQKRTRVGPTR